MNSPLVILFFFKLKLIYLHMIKWFQVLLCNTNNSIFLHTVKRFHIFHTKFYLHTVKWLQVLLYNTKIQFNISHLFAHS